MNKRFLKYASFGLIGLLVLVLMAATVLEKIYGTELVSQKIYASPLFVLLWAVAALSSVVYLFRSGMRGKAVTLCLHLSFVLILAGALVTHLFGLQGAVHLRQDGLAATTFALHGGATASFPFKVALKEFRLIYYPGTFAPMDFVSTIAIDDPGAGVQEGEVSMNHIYSYRGYRFYQSKYDADGKGATLSVAHDPYGIAVTYTGYALLLLSMLGFFFQKASGFRRLLRHPLLRKAYGLVALAFVSGGLQAASGMPKALPEDVAEEFGNLYIYYNDRLCPLQSLARDFTVKLYGKPEYKGLTSEQVLTGWFFYYDDWKTEPLIRVKSKDVRSLLGIQGGYARLTDFVDAKGYKLEAALRGSGNPKDRQAVEQANEQFNLVSMVATGSILTIYPYRPEEGHAVWYSLADKLPADMPEDQWAFIRNSMNYVAGKVAAKQYAEVVEILGKIRKYQVKEAGTDLPSDTRFYAEKLYGRANYVRFAAMFCATVGLLAFVFYCRRIVSSCRSGRSRLHRALLWLLGIVFAYLTFLIVLRGYVSGHLPLSNGFETMQFMAWCSVLLTFFLQRRFRLAVAFGFLLCGLTLLVAMMGESNPKITQLMPVLSSPLLSIHVMTIMFAYSLLAFVMLNGVTAVVLHYSRNDCSLQIERLQLLSRIVLYPAVFLLALGIFVGAVWANVSWGRYWGWDPKEVWALVTMLVYAMALHPVSLPWFRRPIFFHVFSIIAFLTVLITYFGVNFLLGGMHSYS